MPLFGGCRTERRIEAFRIHQLLPGDFVAFAAVGQIEIPRGVAVKLADIDKGVFVAWQRLEKSGMVIPEFPLDERFDLLRLGLVLLGDIDATGKAGDLCDGDRIAVHVGIDRGAFARAADGDLHAVAVVDLPEQAVGA